MAGLRGTRKQFYLPGKSASRAIRQEDEPCSRNSSIWPPSAGLRECYSGNLDVLLGQPDDIDLFRSVAISALITYTLLRPLSRQQLVTRLPLFLVDGGGFLFGAVVTLPEASPHIVERILGHSLDDIVTRRLSSGHCR